jgi:hypothetical protein
MLLWLFTRIEWNRIYQRKIELKVTMWREKEGGFHGS